jgi:hypothetical protein
MAINPLQQPVDYFGAMPQVDIGKQFAEFGQVLAERQKRTQAEEVKALYKTDLQAVLDNPSMKAFNEFSLKYPQQREVIKDVASRFTQEQQDSEFNIGRDVAVALENDKPEVALEILNQTIDAREKSKLPIGIYGQVQQILLNTDDPDRLKKAKAQTNFALTLLNPEKFSKAVDSLAKQKLDPEVLREQVAKSNKAVQEAQNVVDTAPDEVAKAAATRKLEEEKAKQEAIKTQIAEATQADEQARLIAVAERARSDADKAVAEKEKAVLEAANTPDRLKAEQELRDAQAKKATIEAKYEERKQVDEIVKRAGDLGLTKAQTNEVLAKTRKLDIETKKAVLELAAYQKSGGVDPSKIFEYEEKIRKEYQGRTKVYGEVQTIFSNLQASAQAKTGPGDIALITGFMKMLDPGSVVRETEFATARDTAGLFESLKNDAQKLESGQLFALNSTQRQQYVNLAQQYLNAAKKKADQDKKDLRVVVDNYKLNPDNVFGPERGGRGEVNRVIPPQAAIDFLKKDPSRAAEFEKKYGPGSASQYLQAR